MTPLSLAPPPAPHETAALPLPTPPEVVALQAVRSYPAVSVLCSTEPGPRMTPVDAARLADLVADAEARLVEEFGTTATAELRDRLRAAAVDASGRATRAAVALFVGDHAIGSWALSVPVSSRAVVDPTFATRDLVRSLHRTPRHVVLVLTEHEARLFDGIGESLVPAVGGSFPMVRQRSAGRRAPARGAAGDAETFLRDVDRALGTYLRLHPAPLLLVGALRRWPPSSGYLATPGGWQGGSRAAMPGRRCRCSPSSSARCWSDTCAVGRVRRSRYWRPGPVPAGWSPGCPRCGSPPGPSDRRCWPWRRASSTRPVFR